MGCGQSSVKQNKSKQKKDLTFDSTYVAISPPTKGLSKRLWSTQHVSLASSSGVSSAYNTPVRNTKTIRNRRRISKPENDEATIQKPPAQPDFEQDLTYQNLPEFLKNVPLDIDCQAEVYEQQRLERQQQIAGLQAVLNETVGYYSDESSDCSTPFDKNFICTQNDSSVEMENSNESNDCNLDMEMELMGKAFGIMPKTSSPILQRRDVTFNSPNSNENISKHPPPASASYQKWQKYLQTTPTYALHNITKIPEAIAGRFCPANFPAFTLVKTTKYRAAKRYPEHSYYQACRNSTETFIKAIPFPIPTTEL